MTIRLMILTILLATLGARLAFGQDLDVLETKRLSVEVFKVGAFNDAYFDEHQRTVRPFSKGVALLWDVSLIKGIYWDNRVWTVGDDAKVQAVGWEWDLFIRPTSKIDIFWRHHSQHTMDYSAPMIVDSERPWMSNEANYPLRDLFGIRINFTPEKPKGGIWP